MSQIELMKVIETKVDKTNYLDYIQKLEKKEILPLEFLRLFQYLYNEDLVFDMKPKYASTMNFLVENKLIDVK